ncbi:MAG: hypothetical protein ABIT01_05190 [Thermoanaerobaculia bacterium]
MVEIPDELRRFFADRVGGSVDQLRIALLLRLESDREWSVGEVAAVLNMPQASTGMRLFLLRSTGVIGGSGMPMTYRYEPASPQFEAMLALIEETYVRSPEALKRLASSGSPDPLQSFAEAFDLRKRNG